MRISDWSSDVCSSDLLGDRGAAGRHHQRLTLDGAAAGRKMETLAALLDLRDRRLRHQGDSGGRAVGEQHVDDLLRGAVAEELAERLLVPGDAGRVDPRAEILDRKSTRLNSSH